MYARNAAKRFYQYSQTRERLFYVKWQVVAISYFLLHTTEVSIKVMVYAPLSNC